jgi:hypothetical protein
MNASMGSSSRRRGEIGHAGGFSNLISSHLQISIRTSARLISISCRPISVRLVVPETRKHLAEDPARQASTLIYKLRARISQGIKTDGNAISVDTFRNTNNTLASAHPFYHSRMAPSGPRHVGFLQLKSALSTAFFLIISSSNSIPSPGAVKSSTAPFLTSNTSGFFR